MAYSGQTLRSPFLQTGLRDDRSQELLPVTSLVLPSKNLNFHENGLSKRGGNSLYLGTPITSLPKIQGGFQFRLSNGSYFHLFAANGSMYQTSESNVLKTGHSTSNPISFMQIGAQSGQAITQYVMWADGQIVPQYWDGSAGSSTSVTAASSWATTSGQPFQIINHARNANIRAWAITKDSVWASKIGQPWNFGDADVIQIPVYTKGGLVGGIDLGGQLFVWDKTKTYLIDDTDSNSQNWGYHESLWEGGAAHWRLVCKANNNLFIMAEDSIIYSLQGIIATGAYASAPLSRPAYIDKFIRDNITLSNIENFCCTYDRKLRAIKWFMQEGGSNNNISLTYFIDKDPSNAWIIHDNEDHPSGYQASAVWEVRNGPGDWQLWTGDFSGNIWKLEQSDDDDNGNPFVVRIRTIRQDLGAPRAWKHFRGLVFRGSASGEVDFDMHSYIDGVRREDSTFTLSGSGAKFDSAHFDEDTFAGDSLIPATIDVGYYGRDAQFEFVQDAIGQSFFLSELIYLFSPRGVRL